MSQPHPQAPAAGPAAPHAPPQSEQQQGQQAVNFNNSANYANTRRVTIGGIHNNQGAGPPPGPPAPSNMAGPNPPGGGQGMDRRGSMASTNFNMDDFFGRRSSMGFDMNMDNLFARRESLDSTAAALDAAIMDLNRRRYSMAMGLPANETGNPASQGQQSQQPPRDSLNTSFGSPPPMSSSAPPAGSGQSVGSITVRQQQLQQQQRELETRQKELELQRQQLIASMHDRGTGSGMGSMKGGMSHPPPQHHSHHQPMMPNPPGSMGGYAGTNSLGLGSVHSHNSMGSGPPPSMQRSAAPPPTGGSGSGSQQWWICQICNSKAFASHDEALQHEQHCTEGAGGGPRKQDNLDLSMRSSMGHSMGGASRNFSMGMDSMHSAHSAQTQGTMHTHHSGSVYDTGMSTGPFAMMEHPMPLAMPSDKDWLTPLHCFVRRHCVEIFSATEQDVATPSKGKRKPINVGQVGIRCPHCHSPSVSNKARERGSIYYPTTISSVYNATMNLLQRHLHSCSAVPQDIMRRYETLKADDARSGTSKRYWVESSLSLGLVDTPNGIRFSALRPPPLPSLTQQQESTGQNTTRRNSNEFFSSSSNAVTDLKDAPQSDPTTEAKQDQESDTIPATEKELASSAPLVTPEDKPYSTGFSHHLLGQMQPCVFTEADRLGKRKGLPPGFPGLACRHCFGGYGSGRFFPSSIKTLSDTSKTLNVLHNHMMRCRKCPAETRETLEKLRTTHDEERAKMKFGSQKAFFARIWERLHGKNAPPSALLKRKAAPPQRQQPQQQQAYHQGGMQQQHGMQHPMHQQQQHPQQHAMHHGYGPAQTGMPQHNMPPQNMPPHTMMGPPGDAGGLEELARHATATDPKRQKTHYK